MCCHVRHAVSMVEGEWPPPAFDTVRRPQCRSLGCCTSLHRELRAPHRRVTEFARGADAATSQRSTNGRRTPLPRSGRLGPLTPHRRPRRPGGERHTHSRAQRPTSKITWKPSHTTPSDLTGTRKGLYDQPHVINVCPARTGGRANHQCPGAGLRRRVLSWNLMHGAACFAPSSFRSVWENSLRSQHSPTSRSEWLPQSCPTIDPS